MVICIAEYLAMSSPAIRTPMKLNGAAERRCADRIEDKCAGAAYIVACSARLSLSQPGMKRREANETIVIEAVRTPSGWRYLQSADLPSVRPPELSGSSTSRIPSLSRSPAILADIHESNVISATQALSLVVVKAGRSLPSGSGTRRRSMSGAASITFKRLMTASLRAKRSWPGTSTVNERPCSAQSG